MSVIALAAGTLLGGYAMAALRRYRRAAGPRLVPCPGTGTAATIELDARRAALLLAPDSELVVSRCSLWPQRAGCAQGCCEGLDPSARCASTRDVLARWYAGKQCSLCHRDIVAVDHLGVTPGLLSPHGELLEWIAVPAETVFRILGTHRPVCAACDVLERVRQRMPPPATPAV